MSKKLMLPFLTEWLIKHGTEPIGLAEMGAYNMDIFYTAMRKGYLQQVTIGSPLLLKLTKQGVLYLQENQK